MLYWAKISGERLQDHWSSGSNSDARLTVTEIFWLQLSHDHGGNSKGTTCVVDRDVTAYLVVDRVLRFPT